VERFQETKLSERRYKENTIKNMALSPRGMRDDE